MQDIVTYCITNYYGIIALVAIAGLIFNIISVIFNGISMLYTQRKSAKLPKDLEKYKHELQTDFIKTQLRTTQLFNIYPKLFGLFKAVEGALNEFQILILLKKPANKDNIDKFFRNEFAEANNYLINNFLFLSSKVKELGIRVKDAMGAYLTADTDEERKHLFSDVEKTLNALEEQMKKELQNNK